MAAKNTVILKNYSNIFEEYEAEAATIYPGCLIELTSGNKVKVHATPGGNALPMFAIEDALQGKTLMDAYADGDKVQYNIQRPGTRFLGVLKVGETVLIGDELISAGDGTLIKASSASSGTTIQKVMAIAEEDLDLTVSDATDNYLICRAC